MITNADAYLRGQVCAEHSRDDRRKSQRSSIYDLSVVVEVNHPKLLYVFAGEVDLRGTPYIQEVNFNQLLRDGDLLAQRATVDFLFSPIQQTVRNPSSEIPSAREIAPDLTSTSVNPTTWNVSEGFSSGSEIGIWVEFKVWFSDRLKRISSLHQRLPCDLRSMSLGEAMPHTL